MRRVYTNSRYARRFSLRQQFVHCLIFTGICSAAALEYWLHWHEAALLVSLGSNGLWVFHG